MQSSLICNVTIMHARISFYTLEHIFYFSWQLMVKGCNYEYMFVHVHLYIKDLIYSVILNFL